MLWCGGKGLKHLSKNGVGTCRKYSWVREKKRVLKALISIVHQRLIIIIWGTTGCTWTLPSDSDF